ncbi:HU family DNA-binding protein [Gymnodinialimonas ceratoperidinii]|uniref:HU family DNA-binding protein n=1 Tax=Gymnodinialimonas ceratoperidinii TaxID=2856823 RepID=A0A8F6TVM5_9RHOB|nr:HU family DNA-binding protein [Gymnodinialimonas ceratoperidinii]QXT38521.1 HU family DNA-binding protein [Gymnodinialimonas ceratoperidinii]
MATKTTRKRKSTSAGPRRSSALGARSAAKTSAPVSAAKAAPQVETKADAPAADPVITPAAAPADTPDTTPATDDRLKRPDLIEAVAKRVSLKRSEAKMVFDVVLDEIGKALDASDEVVVPPLGKLMVKKRMEKPGGDMLTLKLKRAAADPAAGDVAPLADTDQDS